MRFVPGPTVAVEPHPGAALIAALVAGHAAATGEGLPEEDGPGAFTLTLAAAVARGPRALARVPEPHASGLPVLTVADTCGLVTRPGRFAVKAGDCPLAVSAHLVALRRLPGIGRALFGHAALPLAQSAPAAAPLRDRGRAAFAGEATGEALPIAGDGTPRGRQINRRVEARLRPLAPAAP
jgi:hypothetical protein